MKFATLILAAFLAVVPMSAKSSHSSKSKCASCARSNSGKIKRSSAAKHEFMRQSGYPHGRKGMVVDHIVSLKHGGSDTPSNMQWQTRAEAKAKDRTE